MRRPARPALAVMLTAWCGASPATAEPDDLVGLRPRPQRGELWLDTTLELNLSHQRGGSRAIAPDLWWGLSDQTSLGIAHSARSLARIDDLGGLCVLDCAERPRYAVAALVKHGLFETARLDVALQAGALLRDVDPWKPALLVGAAARWRRGRVALSATPYLQLGVANTDLGNRHRVVVPLRATVQPTCGWALGVHTGVEGELAVLRDAYHVPLAASTSARLSERLVVTAEAGFASLLGPQNTGYRSLLTVSLEARL
ncbi:MAG: hypothetical protein R3B48_29400 [Kofleriaceae bacterium]